MCVKSNSDDVYPSKINSLTLSSDNGVDATPIDAVDGASFLTETGCNSGVCYAKTMMKAEFFDKASQSTVKAGGTVLMAFGSDASAKRRLGLDNSLTLRSLESETTAINQFDLEIQVERGDNIGMGDYSGAPQYERKVFVFAIMLVGSIISQAY